MSERPTGRVDGKALSPRELARELGEPGRVRSAEAFGRERLSQEEHPVTGAPFLMLHQCQDDAKLQHLAHLASSNPKTTLLCWFASAAPLVRLRIAPHQWLALRAAAQQVRSQEGRAR